MRAWTGSFEQDRDACSDSCRRFHDVQLSPSGILNPCINILMIAGRERMYAQGPWIVARAENMHVGGSLMSSYDSEIAPVNTELSGQR